MNIEIIKALIALAGTVIGVILTAVLGPMVKDWVESRNSSRTRLRSNIPEIISTKWSAVWRFQDGAEYVSDTITFSKWTRNSQFEGYGEVTHGGKQYKYTVSGEVSPARIVVFTYKAERFPTEANIGIACLELSVGADELQGTWSGLVGKKQADGTKIPGVHGGSVKMQKIKELKP
jgi:hypothetical protein